jgi:WD40 repeat protein
MRDATGRRLGLLGTMVILLAAALPGLAQKDRDKTGGKKPPPEPPPPPALARITPVGDPLEHRLWVRGTAFTADSKLLITACADQKLRAWSVATGRPHGEPMAAPHSINCLALSPDGTLALIGCGNAKNTEGEAQVWDVAAGQLLDTLETHGPVWGVAFSEDGKLLTGTYHPDNNNSAAQVWDWDGTKAHHVRDIKHQNVIWTVALSSDGKTAATGGTDHTIRLFEADTGTLIGEPRPLPFHIWCVAFAPGGKRVLAACGEEHKKREERAGEVHVWVVDKAKPAGRIVYREDIQAAIFSPNHKYILTGDADRTARLWNAGTDAAVSERFECPVSVLAVAYSPDGQYVAVGGAVEDTPHGRGAAQIYRLPNKLWDVGERRHFIPRRVGGKK